MQRSQRNPFPKRHIPPVRRADGQPNVPKRARRLPMGDGIYRFVVGKNWVQVWEPNGTKHLVNLSEITGLPWPVIEQGQWKRTRDGAVMPYHVRLFVERGFTPATTPVDVG